MSFCKYIYHDFRIFDICTGKQDKSTDFCKDVIWFGTDMKKTIKSVNWRIILNTFYNLYTNIQTKNIY